MGDSSTHNNVSIINRKLLLIDSRVQDTTTIINAANDDTYCLVFNYYQDTTDTLLSKIRFLNDNNRYIEDNFYYFEPKIKKCNGSIVLANFSEITNNTDPAPSDNCVSCTEEEINNIQLVPSTLYAEHLSFTLNGPSTDIVTSNSSTNDISFNLATAWPYYDAKIHKPVFFQRSIIKPINTDIDMTPSKYKQRGSVFINHLDEIYELAKQAQEVSPDTVCIHFQVIGVIQHANATKLGYKLFDNQPLYAQIDNVSTNDSQLNSWAAFSAFIQILKTKFNLTTLDLMACALYSNPDWKYIIDTLSVQQNIIIHASYDDTGASSSGGNWILETNDINLTSVYFTPEIYNWKFLLTSSNQSYALQFDGADNAIILGTPEWSYSTQIRDTFTVECWFKTTDTSEQKDDSTFVSRWITSGDESSGVFTLGMGRGGGLRCSLTNQTGMTLSTMSNTSYLDSLWHHVALTYNSSSGVVTMYIDGYYNNSQPHESYGSLSYNSTLRLIIGSDDGGTTPNFVHTDRQFRGFISDVRMWNVVRSAYDISSNYQQRLIGNETGLVGYWKLNQGYGTGWGTYSIAVDSTVNRTNGTIASYSEPQANWVVSDISFNPRITNFVLGPKNGVYDATDSSFSFIDPSSNSFGDFSYSIDNSNVTIADGEATTKIIYSNTGPITLPTLNTYDFPMLADLSNWQIDISFTVTDGYGTWRPLIGDMYNDISPNNRGWGLWVSAANSIHWGWLSVTYEPSFSVNLNTAYIITVIGTNTGSVTLILKNAATSAVIGSSSITLSNTQLGRGPVTFGGWRNTGNGYASGEFFPGTISYVNVSVPTVNRVVTLLSGPSSVITASQTHYFDFVSSTKTANLTIAAGGVTPTTITRASDDYVSGTISKTYAPDLTFSVAATSSRGTAVSYTSSDTSVATVDSSTGLVTVLNAGLATIIAEQSATSQYEAGSASWDLTVARASNSLTRGDDFTNTIITRTYDPTSTVFLVSASSDVNSSTDVVFTSNDPNVAYIERVNATTSQITINAAGAITITASQAESTQYAAATITSVLIVWRASNSLTRGDDFTNTIIRRTYDPTSTVFVVSASSDVNSSTDVVFTSSDPNVAYIERVNSTTSQITINTAGSITITASQAESTQYEAATITSVLTVALGTNPWSNTFAITSPVAFGDTVTYTAPVATYSPAGAITYSTTTDVSNVATINESTGVITLVGNGTVTFRANQAETSQYWGSTIDSSAVTVNRANTTITRASDAYFSGTINKTYAPDLTFSVAATSSRGTAVSYSSSDTSVATVDSSTGLVTVLKAGPTTISASQTETSQYEAGSASWALTVALGSNPWSNTFAITSPVVFGDTVTYTAPVATYSPAGAITYHTTTDVSNVATINESTGVITLVGNGTVTFRANHWPTSQYTGSTIDSSAVTVNRANTTITRASDDYVSGTINKTYAPDLTFSVAATSSRGTAVSYSSSDTSVATVDSSTGLVTVLKAGPTTISASQTETSQYEAGSASWALTVALGTNPWSNTFVITSPKTYGDAVTYTAPVATYSPAGAITYSTTTDVSNVATINSSSGAITLVGNGTVTFRATQAETSQYASSTIDSGAVTVNRANTTITRTTDTSGTISKTYASGLTFSVAATSSRGTAVSYTSSDTTVATVDPSTGLVTVLKTGPTTITAAQTQTSQYVAGSASWALTVARGTTAIIGIPTDLSYSVTNAPFYLVPSTASGGTITYSLSDPSSNVATVNSSSGLVTLKKAGVVTIVVSQAQSALYNAPSSVSCILSVSSAGNSLENVVINSETQSFSGVDLSGASLAGATMTGVSFDGASLAGASLAGANVSGASFAGTSLVGASLAGANISGASFAGASLSNADLSGADISGVNFSNANISGANISGLSFAPVQKLQLLKNTNNRQIDQVQIENVTGDVVLSVVPPGSTLLQMPNIETAVFKVIVPNTSTSPTAPLINVPISQSNNADAFYLPISEGEYFKISNVKYYIVGTTIKNYLTNATVDVLIDNGKQYRLFVGSIAGVTLEANTLSSSTFIGPNTRLISDTRPIYTTTRPTSNSDATIVYSSNNPSVATINSSGEQITMISAGSVSFTASQAATLTHASGSITSNTFMIYSTEIKISFNVAAFDSVLQMDVSGTLPGATYQLPTTDATSVFYVKLDDFKNVFKFQTDSFDINDASMSDIRYYVFKNKWPSALKLNPSHSMTDVSESTGMMGSSGMFAQNKALLKHDYVRYLAYKLFRTIHGVDLFKNESDLLENLTYWGEAIRNDIEAKLDAISTTSSDATMSIDNSGNRFLTNDATTNTNISRELMTQIIGNSPDRLFDISGTTNIQSIPLMENDSFNIVITVMASNNQNVLTGVESISSRSYNMKVIMKNDITGLNTRVIDSEMYPNSYPYSGNVISVDANTPAVYADGSPPQAIPTVRYGYNGWYYANSNAWVNVSPTVRRKINWYLAPNVATSTVADLRYIRMNLRVFNRVSTPFFTVYTKATGSGDAGGWYKSKRTYIIWNANSLTNGGKYCFYVNLNSYTTAPAVIGHTNAALTFTDVNFSSVGSFASNEVLFAISIGSDSGSARGNVEFTLSSVIIGDASGEKEYGYMSA